jgi:hypothetical protein
MFFSKDLHTFQGQMFDLVSFLTFFLYLIIALGLSSKAPEYLNGLQYYTKLYVGLFLLWRFNPFRHVRFTELDGKIAFSAGVFLLTTTVVENIIHYYLKELRSIIL